ncbi:MAG TPA: isoprenylcysteine carboxylmethyltransferase family protein [Candidatus Acidoferrales bacterium]|nr:isoprenylcysteine carboxylmethyltransferase family protein [Candidatus Acidoferrales bacterium]
MLKRGQGNWVSDDMTSPRLIVGILWLAFTVYWFVGALRTKRALRKAPWWQGRPLRVAIVLIVFALTSIRPVRRPLYGLWREMSIALGPIGTSVGLALCVLGFGFAVWARVYLGSNWGMPMSLREGHELVTTGPYAYARHPIYGGILLAMIGSTIVAGPPWFFILLLFGAYFIYSAKVEEKTMAREFPNLYPAYEKRTKMLLPFLF